MNKRTKDKISDLFHDWLSEDDKFFKSKNGELEPITMPIDRFIDAMYEIVIESNRQYGLELLGVVLDRFVNVEAVAAATKDPVSDFYDVESFIRQLKSKVEKGESISLYAEKENGNDHIRDDTKMVESNREAYKQGAMDAIEATKIEQIIYYTNAELMGLNPLTEEQKINFAERVGKESSRMQACSEQENKAKEFLESLKNNSVSEIPTDSSD